MDRLSNLPDPIRNQIVSCLPTKEALRTSVLSSQWRYISSALPKFDFRHSADVCNPISFKLRHRSEVCNSNSYEFGYRSEYLKLRHCVYKTLTSHDETDLESLSLKFLLDEKYITSTDLSTWVNIALKHRIQRFYLDVYFYEETLDLPCDLFQCESLQILHLENCSPRMPSTIRFSNLRTLVFESIYFPHQPDDIDLVNRILNQTTLPVLESLEIKGCPQFHTLCISIPSLVMLNLVSYGGHQRVFVSIPSLQRIYYFGCLLEVCSKTLASLKTAMFEFPCFLNPDTGAFDITSADASDIPSADASDIPNTDASDILFGLCNVEMLFLKAAFIESLSNDQFFFGKSPILSATLKHLHLEIYQTKKQFQVISFLLKCFPKLQGVHIYYYFVGTPEHKLAEDEFVLASDFCFQGVSKLPYLEIIKVHYFGGTEPERDLVLYLLQRASDLTKVNITYKQHLKEHQITDIEKLLTLPRGSV